MYVDGRRRIDAWGERCAPHLVLACACVGVVAGATAPGHAGPLVGTVIVAGVWAGTRRHDHAVVVFLCTLLCVAGYTVASGRLTATSVDPVSTQERVTGVATVEKAVAQSRHGWRYIATLRLDGSHPETRHVAARSMVFQRAGVPPTPGDLLKVTGRLGSPGQENSPGWWRRYLERNGVQGILNVSDTHYVGRRRGLAGIRDTWVRQIRAQLAAVTRGDDQAVTTGIVLGFDERLTRQRREAFRRAGTAHLLAVSGQNVALVGVATLTIVRVIGATRYLSLGLAATTVVAYALVCQPGASVARATLVGLIAITALAWGQPRRSVYTLMLAFVGIVGWQPRALTDPGFILSFSAVVGIFALAGSCARVLERALPRVIAQAVAISGAATLGTAPACVVFFGEVSVVGLVANLVAVPLAGVVLVAGLVGALASIVGVPAAGLCLMIAGGGAHLIIRVSDVAASLPGATVGPWGATALGGVGATSYLAWRLGWTGDVTHRFTSPRLRDLRRGPAEGGAGAGAACQTDRRWGRGRPRTY